MTIVAAPICSAAATRRAPALFARTSRTAAFGYRVPPIASSTWTRVGQEILRRLSVGPRPLAPQVPAGERLHGGARRGRAVVRQSWRTPNKPAPGPAPTRSSAAGPRARRALDQGDGSSLACYDADAAARSHHQTPATSISFPDTWSHFLNEMQPGVPARHIGEAAREQPRPGSPFHHRTDRREQGRAGRRAWRSVTGRIRPYEWGAVLQQPGLARYRFAAAGLSRRGRSSTWTSTCAP